MNSRFFARAVLTVLCLFGVGISTCQPSLGQQTADPQSPAGNPRSVFLPVRSSLDGKSRTYVKKSEDAPRQALVWQLKESKEKLKEARGEERTALTSAIKQLLDQYFEADMDVRRAELERLQKRADGTEAILEKRNSSRDDLIDLQTQAIVHDAEGLGLFGSRETEREINQPRTLGFMTGVTANVSNAPLAEVVKSAAQLPREAQRTVSQVTASDLETARQAALEKIANARRSLKTSADEDGGGAAGKDSKVVARQDLKAALGEYFDADMKIRRSELAKIRSGLEAMERRLQKRQDAKDDIVDLKLKIIANESEGLGFFNGDVGGNELMLEYDFYPPGSILPVENAPPSMTPSVKKRESR